MRDEKLMFMTTLLGRIQAQRNLIDASLVPTIMYLWGDRKLTMAK